MLTNLFWKAISGTRLRTQLTTSSCLLVRPLLITPIMIIMNITLSQGVFFSELASNFKSFSSGRETHKVRLHVGHDGTMIRLAAGLGLGKETPLRWPALGSEIVMEVCYIPKRYVIYDADGYDQGLGNGDERTIRTSAT
jgi:hypothetical protein